MATRKPDSTNPHDQDNYNQELVNNIISDDEPANSQNVLMSAIQNNISEMIDLINNLPPGMVGLILSQMNQSGSDAIMSAAPYQPEALQEAGEAAYVASLSQEHSGQFVLYDEPPTEEQVVAWLNNEPAPNPHPGFSLFGHHYSTTGAPAAVPLGVTEPEIDAEEESSDHDETMESVWFTSLQ